MAVETLLLVVKGLGWVVNAATGGVVEGRAEEGFQRVQRGLRERLPGLLGRPEGADLVRGVRRAQFRALDQLIRDSQDVAPFGKLAEPSPFIERALAYCQESLRLVPDYSTVNASEATRIVSAALAEAGESGSIADGGSDFEDAVLGELQAALHGVSSPPAFESHFRNGERGRRRFGELFAIYVAEEIQDDAVFRNVLNVHLHLQTLGAASDASKLAEQILQQFGPVLEHIEETADEIRATQVEHGATLDEISATQVAHRDEILRAISAERGVPFALLRQILERLGELEVPDERIAERLDAWAGEYLTLREKWSQVEESTLDVAAIKTEVLALIDAGNFDGARQLFGDARQRARAARHGLAREEASFLAGEADVDRLELRYSDAAERYAEAASLVSTVDPTARLDYLWKRADTNFLLGDEFGQNSALLEAIKGWRQLLDLYPRESKPLLWAATQSSLGNALARLGERESGTTRLEEAVAAYRAALEERTREAVPLAWAMTQNNLGAALSSLGERETGTVRLEEAVAAYRAAVEERSRERTPLAWATTQNNLGNALTRLGVRESGTARLEEAVAAYRAALEERSRESEPLLWATIQNNLGNVLTKLGERERGTPRLEEAVAAFRSALQERARDRVPLEWAMTQNNLGAALQCLGARESGTVRLEEAVAVYRAALEERTRERVPLAWATTQNNLGNALATLGERESGTARLEEAVAAYQAALQERTRERVPLAWATTQNNLGNALRALGERESATARLEEAVAAYRAALEILVEGAADHFALMARRNLERTLRLLMSMGT